MAQVSLRRLVKEYEGGVQAVKGIDLDIEDEEFVVLVGPSGCGKSTTLRMIAGLEEITGGDITIGGDVVNDIPPRDRDIAMVFQNYALYPHMSVYDNMAFGLKMRKFPKAEIAKRVQDAAEILSKTIIAVSDARIPSLSSLVLRSTPLASSGTMMSDLFWCTLPSEVLTSMHAQSDWVPLVIHIFEPLMT